jgi:sulfate transport system substrate-binding protein
VITPNPKTSGGARWNFLAAWGYALKKNGGNEAKARELVGGALQERARARHGRARLDHDLRRARDRRRADRVGERGAARGRGDRQGPVRDRRALGERARRAARVGGRRVARRKGTSAVATAYLEYLYSPEAQELIAKHHYRPTAAAVAAKHASEFPSTKLLSIDEFGGWKAAQAKFFADGGVFDQIYQPGR